jgi:hypothetical protein
LYDSFDNLSRRNPILVTILLICLLLLNGLYVAAIFVEPLDSFALAGIWFFEWIGGIPQGAGVLRLSRAGINERIALLRCIFGNPFQPITLDRSWITSTVVSLAQQMYDTRDFSPLPILADALQDCGCDNPQILEHCRGPGPHVRGCFLIDLVLGKG